MLTHRTTTPPKNYFVQISIDGKGQVTHYFYNREEAELFFIGYCLQMGIKHNPLLPIASYFRAKRKGVTVDFEKISALTLSSIFDLS